MPTIKELEAQLAALRDAEAAESRERNQLWADAWNAFMETRPFVYQSTPTEYREFMSKEPPVPAVRVLRSLDPVALEDFQARWGGATPDAYTRPQGMVYFRTDEGILYHGGGGTYVLKSPKLCSDAEWAQIVAGDVPDKFKR